MLEAKTQYFHQTVDGLSNEYFPLAPDTCMFEGRHFEWRHASTSIRCQYNLLCSLTFRTHFCKTLPQGKQSLQFKHLPRCVYRLSRCLHSTLNVSRGACQIYTFPPCLCHDTTATLVAQACARERVLRHGLCFVRL